ncbi:hypothetical protein H9P43_006451 [Blastocladiella emersonii ATCC 22665]|nr:hypothetical protein H9P43_006451 [Blastocladiella emersonii ATCC 22665]
MSSATTTASVAKHRSRRSRRSLDDPAPPPASSGSGSSESGDVTMSTRTAIESSAANRPPRRKRHSPTNVILPWCDYTAPASAPSAAALTAVGGGTLVQRAQRWVSSLWPSSSESAGLPPPPWTAAHGVPPELAEVCIIGVHGWFPMKFVQRVVGEPTGTSGKFCEQMEQALRQWVAAHYGGAEVPSAAITSIALEAEGKVEHRVDKLFEQVIDPALSHAPPGAAPGPSHKSYWQHKLESCRTLFVATHSQGTPTSVLLVEKLVETGIVDLATQRVVILAQAGISHGPFPWNASSMYVKYLEADAARELFEFNRHDSPLSKRYRAATEFLLERGAKLTLVSSWLDQVVPLYSSAFHALSHHNVFRAVFIDAENFYADDFLAHLVVFALAVRNAGLADNDLLVYLSDVVAGSLYFGTAGHSTLYEDVRVYELAINFLFTPSPAPVATGGSGGRWWGWFSRTAQGVEMAPFDAPMRLNSYHLPWILHSLVASKAIRAHPTLSRDLRRLVQLYREWEVSGSRTRQQLKYKLDALHRAKL